MNYGKVDVAFKNEKLNAFMKSMQNACQKNIYQFFGKPVLVEGDIWVGLWLETQPMGGAMFGRFYPEIATNNLHSFLERCRDDGLIPHMITLEGDCWWGSLTFNAIAPYGVDVVYQNGLQKEEAQLLYDKLEKQEDFLWKTRDRFGKGVLEQWCTCDTGEDGSIKNDLPRDVMPPNIPLPSPGVPHDVKNFEYSYGITADGYSYCKELENLSRILDNGKADYWKERAAKIFERSVEVFWDDEKGAEYDRHSDFTVNPSLTHFNIRAMHQGMFTQEMADRFVHEHLLNPDEFWTKMPLPSIAANDEKYRSVPNSVEYCHWSGPSMGLTYQRCIRGLENYGYDDVLNQIAHKVFDKLMELDGTFPVQFQAETGVPNGRVNGYGPMILAALEMFVHTYGVYQQRDKVVWSGIEREEVTYTQELFGKKYKLVNNGKTICAFLDGVQLFEKPCGYKITTDLQGTIVKEQKVKD